MAEIIKMDEKTYRIEDGFVRYFLLIGEEKAMLIDSGVSSPDARETAEKITSLPIELYNTHGDGDHIAGSGAFDTIHMKKEDFIGCTVAERFPDISLCEIHDGDIIDLGGRTVEIIEIPGHTSGSVAFLDIEARRLFAGDSVQTGHIFMFGERRDPDHFAASLEKLISLRSRYDTIIASHDEPELRADYAEKVLDGWNRVKSGEISYSDIDLFGNRVKSYDTEFVGFYL